MCLLLHDFLIKEKYEISGSLIDQQGRTLEDQQPGSLKKKVKSKF